VNGAAQGYEGCGRGNESQPYQSGERFCFSVVNSLTIERENSRVGDGRIENSTITYYQNRALFNRS
jgi:hypothetical protein